MEETSDYSRPGDRLLSDEDYFSEATKNFLASQAAYTTLKNKARMATSAGISKSVPQVGSYAPPC